MIYYLSLGANLGNREQTIKQAINLLHCSKWSSFYYSKPIGFESPHEFCNCVAVTESDLEPLDFLHFTQAIERQLGRTRKSENGQHFDREIDIDLLLAYPSAEGSLTAANVSLASAVLQICTADLTLPHPKMRQRPFVMEPLSELFS